MWNGGGSTNSGIWSRSQLTSFSTNLYVFRFFQAQNGRLQERREIVFQTIQRFCSMHSRIRFLVPQHNIRLFYDTFDFSCIPNGICIYKVIMKLISVRVMYVSWQKCFGNFLKRWKLWKNWKQFFYRFLLLAQEETIMREIFENIRNATVLLKFV